MPTPVSMFKTDDGQIFESLQAAVIHEQKTFMTAGLLPILSSLLVGPPSSLSEEVAASIASAMVEGLMSDRPKLQELQKLFAKLQLAPTTPVARKRARTAKKKPASPEAPPTPEAPAAPDTSELPPFVPDAPTPEHLADLEGLAGSPIHLPTAEGQAPPPPSA